MTNRIIKVHDKHQIEIKLACRDIGDTSIHSVMMYFFVPNSLDINQDTYHKDDFYDDLRTYLRFKTPVVSLKNICSGENNPLQRARKSLEQLTNRQNKNTIGDCNYNLKILCCILKSTIRDYVYSATRKENLDKIEISIDRYVARINEIISGFRKLSDLSVTKDGILPAYLVGDEYISYLIEDYSYQLLESIKKLKLPHKKTAKKKLLRLIKQELRYRRNKKYFTLTSDNTDNEEVLFRRSFSKKFVESALFLKTKIRKEGQVFEQVLFGIAAGLSMMFATGIIFFSQKRFGTLTLPVFMILIVSYMLKDRIKELMRSYFASKVHHRLFDYKTELYDAEKEKIGWVKEGFGFVEEQNIPENIATLRDCDYVEKLKETRDHWADEKTILYKERVKLISGRVKNVCQGCRVRGINIIMRFNIFKFLNKMDSSKKHVYILKKGGYKKTRGERVYHLNAVIKYSSQNKDSYDRIRLILNKEGIKRIEKISIESS